MVELAAFVLADDAHGDLGVQRQRVANPARHFVARQDRAVFGGAVKAGKLQGQRQAGQGHDFRCFRPLELMQ